MKEELGYKELKSILQRNLTLPFVQNPILNCRLSKALSHKCGHINNNTRFDISPGDTRLCAECLCKGITFMLSYGAAL